jgi:Flp pilus assembly protein TadG
MAGMTLGRRLWTTRENSRRGLILIETALIIMVILLLTFGVMEYGWMFMQAQHVINAARQGARVGVRADSVNGDATSAVNAILSAQGITNYTVSFSPSDVSAPDPGDPLTVTVTAPYADLTLTGLPFLPVPANLQSAVTMSKEGPY